MKKIVIILAFIFVGMVNAMEQRSLLDGNEVHKYAHSDEEIAYQKEIQDLYHCIQQRESRTQKEIQSEGPTRGPGIEQIFSFLAPVQNHNVSHAKPLIRDFCSVENTEGQQDRATADRREKELEKLQSIFFWQIKDLRKRTCEEAASSDEKNRGLPEEPVASKRAANKSSTSSEDKEICGINGCQYQTAFSCEMDVHKKGPHELTVCPYPGCSAPPYLFYSDFLQHVKDAHPEIRCDVCHYAPKGQNAKKSQQRNDLLRHFQSIKHRKNLAFINSKEGQIVWKK